MAGNMMALFQRQLENIKKNLENSTTPKKFSKQMQQDIETELRQSLIKARSTHEEKILKVIGELINKEDVHDLIVGFISITAYCKILNENEILSFVNNFILSVFQKIFLSSDQNLIDLGVSVYGNLVSQGGRSSCDTGINIAPHIEEGVSYCINNLGHKDRGYASLMMLVELLKHAQFITFNKIRKYKYLDLFKKIIDEKNQKIRKKGLELIDECVREISKRDKNQQSSMLTGIFNEFFKDNQPTIA